MEYNIKLHPAQTSVLVTLRHATRARYGELRVPTGLESDIFKYHLRKLVRAHSVVKADDGIYELTAEGKEFANRLDDATGREIAQPKSSMLLVVRTDAGGVVRYLAHRRTREPFRDYWGIASAPLLRGVPALDSAARELRKQTGIDAQFRVAGTFRVIDARTDGTVLEDKLSCVMAAVVDDAPEPSPWTGGVSQWMTKRQLLAQLKLFPTTARTLELVEGGAVFDEAVCYYAGDEY